MAWPKPSWFDVPLLARAGSDSTWPGVSSSIWSFSARQETGLREFVGPGDRAGPTELRFHRCRLQGLSGLGDALATGPTGAGVDPPGGDRRAALPATARSGLGLGLGLGRGAG